MAYVYNKYVVPNFSFIYLNEALAVVLKYRCFSIFSGNTCAKVFFFINSLQLEVIPIKRCASTGVFLTIKIPNKAFNKQLF